MSITRKKEAWNLRPSHRKVLEYPRGNGSNPTLYDTRIARTLLFSSCLVNFQFLRQNSANIMLYLINGQVRYKFYLADAKVVIYFK